MSNPKLIAVTLIACLLGSLTACANSPTGEALEQTFAADPRLNESPATAETPATQNNQSPNPVTLPENFPTEIPRYPAAQLESTPTVTNTEESGETRWGTSDPINFVQNFYQKEFQGKNWQVEIQPSNDSESTLVARQNDLEVTISFPKDKTNSENATEFIIQYSRNSAATPEKSDFTVSLLPSLEAGEELGTLENTGTDTTVTTQASSNLEAINPNFRQNIEDLAALGVFDIGSFAPNQIMTRREYARWLVAANNLINANRPGQQIRLADDNDQPAFTDISKSDRDFPAIQGLAEAGLIPSPLSGDTSAALFRPDAPVTRETLILWKVPLDTRSTLPQPSVDAAKQSWGFQDAAKIDPKALRAVLGDFQNGESANIRRVYGYTKLFLPKKNVTKAEAATTLWYFGSQGEGLSAKDALQLKGQNQPSQPASTSPSP